MEMTDRLIVRKLITASLTVALMAYSSPASAQVRCASLEEPDCTRGYNPHHGEDPACPPTYESGTPPAYNPQYITVVIIDFNKDWVMNVHHASFPLHPGAGGNTPNYRLDLALDVISWVNSGPSRKLGHLKFQHFQKLDHVPYPRQAGSYPGKRHIPSFDEFAFRSQNEIFIFLKSPDILLNKLRLLRFTQYSENYNGIMGKNFAFFNARCLEGSNLGQLGRYGKLIRVENYVTQADASVITTPPVRYSMNIHYKIPALPEVGLGQRYVPMIIDPDTGNGTGNEP